MRLSRVGVHLADASALHLDDLSFAVTIRRNAP